MVDTELLRQFVIEELLMGDDSNYSDELSFYDSGIIDSTGLIELVGFIEKTYDITFRDDEIVHENLKNVSAIQEFLNKKLKK